MDRFALVVEDDPRMVRAFKSLFTTLEDRYEIVASLEEARARYKQGGIDYVLLDLKIPADSEGDFADIENGMTFLRDIRKTPGGNTMPVFPMTSFVVEGLKLSKALHDLGALDCLPKPFESPAKVAATIDGALKSHAPAATCARVEAFSATPREMAIYADRIVLCGQVVWHDTAQPAIRNALALLSKKESGVFVRKTGPDLERLLDHGFISKRLNEFCQRVAQVMKAHGISCGPKDLLGRTGTHGYHFTDGMTVRVIGDWALKLGINPEHEDPSAAQEATTPPLNKRQQWVLDQIDSGRQISQKDVLAHFSRECNASTVKRDLKGLRENGLIETHADGHYVRSGR